MKLCYFNDIFNENCSIEMNFHDQTPMLYLVALIKTTISSHVWRWVNHTLLAGVDCCHLVVNKGLHKCYRRISNWASPRTSALKPRLSVSSHNTDARQTIERLTLSSYSACVNTENLVIKPGSAQIDVNFVNLKFVYIYSASHYPLGRANYTNFAHPLVASKKCTFL